MNPTPLTKSRFILANTCPRKLTYYGDSRYANLRAHDVLLESLARSGDAIGAVARAMHPGGIEIKSFSTEDQLRETRELLERPAVTLFEATVRAGNLLIRADILIKHQNAVRLIEVKSKGFDPTQPEDGFRSKTGLRAQWLPYLRDAAFQAYVLRRAYPTWEVSPALMLVDTGAACTVDTLGTRIRAARQGRTVTVTIDPALNIAEIQPPLLRIHDVGAEVNEILAGSLDVAGRTYPFKDFVEQLADTLDRGTDPSPAPGAACRTCEFYCAPDERNETHRSGWAECMEAHIQRPVAASRADTIFGLYNDRQTDARVASGQFLLAGLTESEIEGASERQAITPSDRHRLQVREARSGTPTRSLRTAALRTTFDSWRFPLHFVDFETATPCIPLHAGHRPNQLLLFQFSHHVLQADGSLAHRTQCLATEPGQPPNITVVGALREALSSDGGTVIHWWHHERTVLNTLREEFQHSGDSRVAALIEFLDVLLGTPGRPDSRLCDLGRLVARTAYFPRTGGSSSVKKVLAAVMRSSGYLRERYGKPIYGTPAMPSLNFKLPWTWWRRRKGDVVDPYTLLPPISPDPDLASIFALVESNETAPLDFVANGGSALVAYAELQRPDLPAPERELYREALLRYCELDTLAMVMVYEALREWVRAKS